MTAQLTRGVPWAQGLPMKVGGLLHIWKVHMKKTVVYIDGFNLFYRALKGTTYKWLDLHALCVAALPKDCEIVAIKYYTARVSGRINPNSPRDQQAYLSALGSLACVSTYFGSFQVTEKFSYLVTPLEFQPASVTPSHPVPRFAKIVKTEEKGSDVNLGVHLVRDAFVGAFEQAAILTNDTDLVEPIRIVTAEAKLPVILLTPVSRPAHDLKKLASSVRHIQPYLSTNQFANPVVRDDGKVIAKPLGW